MPQTARQPVRSAPAAPVTLKGLACFLIQLWVKFTIFGVTATAFLVWCVPSVSLLVAIDVALGSPKRSSTVNSSAAGTNHDVIPPEGAHGMQHQPHLIVQADVKGVGAAAA